MKRQVADRVFVVEQPVELCAGGDSPQRPELRHRCPAVDAVEPAAVPEFEVVLCEILRGALPHKYGICRGFALTAEGAAAGDDIIVFAQDRFPTLKLRRPEDYSRKEQIPIEAAYAYIEAKHTLVLEGNGPGSLAKACLQVAKVKELCSKRKSTELFMLDPYVSHETPITDNSQALHPTRNPMYGAVISRYVCRKKGTDALEDPEEINVVFKEILESSLNLTAMGKEFFPDLIVMGNSNLVLPATVIAGETHPLFFAQDRMSSLAVETVYGAAFGAGLCCLFFALDWVRLGKMPWQEILADAFDIKLL